MNRIDTLNFIKLKKQYKYLFLYYVNGKKYLLREKTFKETIIFLINYLNIYVFIS